MTKTRANSARNPATLLDPYMKKISNKNTVVHLFTSNLLSQEASEERLDRFEASTAWRFSRQDVPKKKITLFYWFLFLRTELF